jgi:glycosyltransferase involved in cell wall biosynthesis
MHAKVPSDEQPLVSVLLLAYQQAHVVQQAVAACLALEGGPYELIFSDDCSRDGTYEAMLAAVRGYQGPHKVRVRQNRRNLGIGLHYNELFSEAKGALLVTAAGDDISMPSRVRKLVEAWDATQRTADLIASHVLDLDTQGQTHGVIEVDCLERWHSIEDWAAHRPYVIGAGQAFTRRLIQRFGLLHPGVFFEDQIMTFRAIALGGAVTVPEALVAYRRGGTSGKPAFGCTEAMFAWRQRQTARELAEMYQLLDDASLLGSTPLMREHLRKSLLRAEYMQEIAAADSLVSRVKIIHRSEALPFLWKWRRALQYSFPEATYLVKKAAAALHTQRHSRPKVSPS